MASEEPPLWSPALQKEALDLMVAAWQKLAEISRNALIEQIISGPSMLDEPSQDQEERERRQHWFDRRIFERLAVIERLGVPPLPPMGEKKLAALRLSYPQWRIQEGDRAHFSTWMESYYGGPEADRTPQELETMSGNALVEALRAEGEGREGRLLAWGQLVARRPGRGVGLLSNIGSAPAPGDEEIWRDTLYGLRDAMGRPAVARRVVDVLIRAPNAVVANSRLLAPTSDALESASKQRPLPISEARFFHLWDQLVTACLGGEAEPPPGNHDWVGRAINRPLGRLTDALLNVMFRSDLKAGQGFPDVFRPRLDRLSTDQPDVLRLARTILASRLPYLFAVDPAWTRNKLLPRFDWQRSEDEATALWRGYGWLARINAGLWSELSSFLYEGNSPCSLLRPRMHSQGPLISCFLM